MFKEMSKVIWNRYTKFMAGWLHRGKFDGTPPEFLARMAGIYETVKTAGDCGVITEDEASILEEFICDCQEKVTDEFFFLDEDEEEVM